MGKEKKVLTEFFELENAKADVHKLREENREKYENGDEVFLTGKMGVAGELNGNGRRYPKDILKREVENYKKLIRENRALGECVEEGSKILTDEGWKDFRDLDGDEYIQTLNRETEEIEYQKPSRVIEKEPDEDYLIQFQNTNIDIKVTPEHRFYLIDRYGDGEVATAEEILNNRTKYDHHYIPKRADWEAPEKRDTFQVGDHEFDESDFASFLGLYLAEGCTFENGNKKIIQITQNEGEGAEKIRELLSDIEEIEWKEHSWERKNGNIKVNFKINDESLFEYLNPLGKAHEKYVPNKVKNTFSRFSLEKILKWYHFGDGRTRGERNAKEVFSVSRELIEDLQEIALKSGRSGNIKTREPQDRHIEGRLIKEENQRPLHILHISTTNGIYLDKRSMDVDKVEYDGKVYCVTVPNSTFYCMGPNGHCFWSKNCDHPDSSVVSLEDASHMITRIWWEGNEIHGNVKVLDTDAGQNVKALLDGGVKIGISSRGLGSVREQGGDLVVEDDYQLIAFDFVSDPSTTGAFMVQENQNPLESQHMREEDKVNRILNDIVV